MEYFRKFRLLCDNSYGLGNPEGLEEDPEFTRKYTLREHVVDAAKRLFKKYCNKEGDLISVSGLEGNEWRPAGLTLGGHYYDGEGNVLNKKD